ncbi:MAG: peptidase S8 [Chloroflexi bacterium]|nr:MAG: peptidase S8 [Chloroflexota bacterium]
MMRVLLARLSLILLTIRDLQFQHLWRLLLSAGLVMTIMGIGTGLVSRSPAESYSAFATMPVANAQSPDETLKTSSTYTIFLPLISNNFCGESFSFNETIRYNLSAINADDTWDCYRGQGIIVAVVDTGIDQDHPDLADNIISGATFVSGTSSPEDDNGHGTHVAGIIAGAGNNDGIIGVAPEASLMPIKVLDSSGSGTVYDVASGIVWAADSGANIINLSLGGVSYSSTLADAVDYAYGKGVLLIAAGGNCGDSSYALNGCYYQDQPQYPAALSNVMAVASTTSSNLQSSFSNQGTYIEISAPGSSIYSTYLYNGYTTLSGTSQAAPHVAGVAALIWAAHPEWSQDEVRDQLNATAQDLGESGWDSLYGYGLVDASAALGMQQTLEENVAQQTLTETAAADVDTSYVPGEIIIKLPADMDVTDIVDEVGISSTDIQIKDTIPQTKLQRVLVGHGREKEMLEQLKKSAGIEFAELNYYVSIQ